MRRIGALYLLLFLAACGNDAVHVAGPFYLWYFKNPETMSLQRCFKPPETDFFCAAEGYLPGSSAFAAGADSRYIVVARHPRSNGVTNKSMTQYFYFARIPEESAGWGKNHEKVIGPLTPAEFEVASTALHLPPLSIVLTDLK